MNVVPFIQWEMDLQCSIDFIENRYCKMACNIENSMRVFDNISFSVLSAFNIHNSVY